MTTATELPKLLPPKSVAEILGVTTGTLAQWRHHSRYPLKYVKVGRKVMYRPKDVDAFIAQRGN